MEITRECLVYTEVHLPENVQAPRTQRRFLESSLELPFTRIILPGNDLWQ